MEETKDVDKSMYSKNSVFRIIYVMYIYGEKTLNNVIIIYLEYLYWHIGG